MQLYFKRIYSFFPYRNLKKMILFSCIVKFNNILSYISKCIFSAKILLFYVIFYAVLSGFFGAMLAVFYQTLDPNAPKWQLDNSLIGSNPGLGFRPMPPESNVESTLIWYKASDEGNYLHWTRELDKFLEGRRDI